jgi:hypothetical protein
LLNLLLTELFLGNRNWIPLVGQTRLGGSVNAFVTKRNEQSVLFLVVSVGQFLILELDARGKGQKQAKKKGGREDSFHGKFGRLAGF